MLVSTIDGISKSARGHIVNPMRDSYIGWRVKHPSAGPSDEFLNTVWNFSDCVLLLLCLLLFS